MRKTVFWQLLAVMLLSGSHSQAQSLKDLFSKDKVESIVNAVTGKNTASMVGTWSFSGAAIEFESDNLLQSAGGAVAAAAAESKLNEQLARFGIAEGKLAFTFNADSTFNARLGTRNIGGTYSYDNSTDKVNLKFAKLIGMSAKVNCTSSKMDLLFNSDKMLDLIAFLSSKSNTTALKTISSLAESYDGMMLGFALKKE